MASWRRTASILSDVAIWSEDWLLQINVINDQPRWQRAVDRLRRARRCSMAAADSPSRDALRPGKSTVCRKSAARQIPKAHPRTARLPAQQLGFAPQLLRAISDRPAHLEHLCGICVQPAHRQAHVEISADALGSTQRAPSATGAGARRGRPTTMISPVGTQASQPTHRHCP